MSETRQDPTDLGSFVFDEMLRQTVGFIEGLDEKTRAALDDYTLMIFAKDQIISELRELDDANI